MVDIQHFERKMHMEYSSNSGKLQMNIDQDSTMFQADIDQIDLNPSFIEIHSMMINKNGINIRFTSPVICESDGENFITKMTGVKINGKTSESFFDGMQSLKQNMFGDKWNESVERQRHRMEKQRKRIHDMIR